MVEVIVASMLGAFVLLSTEVAWWNANLTVVRGSSQIDVQRDASFVLDSVSDTARGSASITIANFGTGVANLVIFKNASAVELARWYRDPANNKLYASKNSGTATQFIITPVTVLTFSASGKQLTTNITLQDTYTQSAAFTTIACLRN